MITTALTGTYSTANQFQSFSATVPSSIRPNTLGGIWASCTMTAVPDCSVFYTAYNPSSGGMQVYVKGPASNVSTNIYVFIIGTL